jgi:hypothetical protein
MGPGRQLMAELVCERDCESRLTDPSRAEQSHEPAVIAS